MGKLKSRLIDDEERSKPYLDSTMVVCKSFVSSALRWTLYYDHNTARDLSL